MGCFFKNCLTPNSSAKVLPVVYPLAPHVPYRNIEESSYYDNSYKEYSRDYNQESVGTSNIEKHYKNIKNLVATPTQKWKTSPLEAYNMDNIP